MGNSVATFVDSRRWIVEGRLVVRPQLDRSSESATDIQGSAQGTTHAGLIGQDVAISGVLDAGGAPVVLGDMLFESTGGLYDMTERFFEVRVDTGTGPLGVTRHVRVSPGGSVRYTILE